MAKAIDDYNQMFKTNFSLNSKSFENYYKDISKRMKNREIDLLIVVGMFLTGFDAPTLNTLFVDKNLKYHGLIQAYSRTNRIYNSTKSFGNIVTFRDLEQPTIDAIKLFGDSNTKNIVLEKSYEEYINGFSDEVNGKKRGFTEVVEELKTKFPDPANIYKESEKKEFVKLFGEYLKLENVLQNFDEFVLAKKLQNSDDVEKFKIENNLSDEMFEKIKNTPILPERLVQDYRSTYNDIREWIRREKEKKDLSQWDDVVFEVDLLKSQEINLDYILELIFKEHKKSKNKDSLIEEVRRVIRASLGHRAKESLIIEFINNTNLDDMEDKTEIIEAFFKFAQQKQKDEVNKLIKDENLKEDLAKIYIKNALKKGYVSENGTELNEMLPKMSPLNPKYLTKKQDVFKKLSAFVDKFRGIGGSL